MNAEGNRHNTDAMQWVVVWRGLGEMIRIGDDIVVQVEKIRPKKVSLTIDAPISVPVQLSEVFFAVNKRRQTPNQ